MAIIKLTINGNEQSIDVDPQMPLLWAIRDVVGLKGHQIRLWRCPVRGLHGSSER